jgi:hypothetical protein
MVQSADTPIHIWNRCHACRAQPIVGRRFECQSCPAGPDKDLCEKCYDRYLQGHVRHPEVDRQFAAAVTHPHRFSATEGKSPDSYKQWFATFSSPGKEPTVRDGCVVRPEFCCGNQSFFGTYAFAVDPQRENRFFVMTALHVMDELIRAFGVDCTAGNSGYTGEELPRLVTGINLYDVFAPNWMRAVLGTAGPMLVIPTARLGNEEPYSQQDVACFQLKAPAGFSPAYLASQPPKVGSPVWLVCKFRNEHRRRTLKAFIAELTEQTCIFRFAEPTHGLTNTSGAPLLDEVGSVIGINIGGGTLDGYHFGHGCHVGSIRRHLGLQSQKSS